MHSAVEAVDELDVVAAFACVAAAGVAGAVVGAVVGVVGDVQAQTLERGWEQLVQVQVQPLEVPTETRLWLG